MMMVALLLLLVLVVASPAGPDESVYPKTLAINALGRPLTPQVFATCEL